MPTIEVGDKVRDPLDGEWREVISIDVDGVFLRGGGVMSMEECRLAAARGELLLPSEPVPNTATGLTNRREQNP